MFVFNCFETNLCLDQNKWKLMSFDFFEKKEVHTAHEIKPITSTIVLITFIKKRNIFQINPQKISN